jgi:class 3 adenylate cyclase
VSDRTEPLGYVVVKSGDEELSVPVFDQLFVGRECAGIPASRRLVISNPEISRVHLEIRLDADTDRAFLIDTSTNGTLLNGLRLERAVPVRTNPGDEIRISDIVLTLHSNRFRPKKANPPTVYTRARISEAPMVMVAGDITNYSTIAEVTDHRVIADSLHRLWGELGAVLRGHRGTLNHYAGDALYAVWELAAVPQAHQLAIEFALAANRRVDELGPHLPLRGPDGAPIRMGWGVAQGMAALAAMTRSVEAVIGDSTNVAFRLSSVAGRSGRAPVMVTEAVYQVTRHLFVWGDPEQLELKGRRERQAVFPVLGHTAPPGSAQPTAPRAVVPPYRRPGEHS